jgi:hypothetical protein
MINHFGDGLLLYLKNKCGMTTCLPSKRRFFEVFSCEHTLAVTQFYNKNRALKRTESTSPSVLLFACILIDFLLFGSFL